MIKSSSNDAFLIYRKIKKQKWELSISWFSQNLSFLVKAPVIIITTDFVIGVF